MKENEMVKIGGKLFRQFAPIDFDGNQWLRTTQLAKMFSLTRSTIWKFVGIMETEPRYKNSILHVKGLWWEEGVRETKKLNAALEKAVKRFAKFNDTEEIAFEYLFR